MVSIFDVIYDNKTNKIINELDKLANKKAEYKFNIFNLSSDNNHRENFNSDIIAALLNPKEKHNEGDLFLKTFISYLNNHCEYEILEKDFNNAKVLREHGDNDLRIDILILNEETRKAIIIESKFNDAEDLENQLNKYYDYIIKSGYSVEALLYLTLRSINPLPTVKKEVNNCIQKVAVFDNKEKDLVNGWLKPCLTKSTDDNSFSLIKQYINLLIYLGFDSMENELMKEFYSNANEDGFFRKLNKLNELANKLPEYRANRFIQNFSDGGPFNYLKKYQFKSVIFQDYWENGNNFKLHVGFFNDERVRIGFRLQKAKTDDELEIIEGKLQQLLLLEEMIKNEENKSFDKYFTMEEYGSMNDIDEAALNFTKKVIDRIKNS